MPFDNMTIIFASSQYALCCFDPGSWAEKRKVRNCFTLPNLFSIFSLFLLPLSHIMSSTPVVRYERGGRMTLCIVEWDHLWHLTGNLMPINIAQNYIGFFAHH